MGLSPWLPLHTNDTLSAHEEAISNDAVQHVAIPCQPRFMQAATLKALSDAENLHTAKLCDLMQLAGIAVLPLFNTHRPQIIQVCQSHPLVVSASREMCVVGRLPEAMADQLLHLPAITASICNQSRHLKQSQILINS